MNCPKCKEEMDYAGADVFANEDETLFGVYEVYVCHKCKIYRQGPNVAEGLEDFCEAYELAKDLGGPVPPFPEDYVGLP